MAKKKSKPVERQDVVESLASNVIEESIQKIAATGVVADCAKLNVRKEPTSNGEIVAVVPSGTIVEIDDSESTADFYRVFLSSGVNGFCMKKFIKML